MLNIKKIRIFPKTIMQWSVFVFLILIIIQVNYLFLFRFFLWEKWESYFVKEKPEVLQVVYGSLMGNDMDIKVIKKRFKNNIYLEFLNQLPDGSSRFINSIQLKGKYESYFEYWGKTFSLALLDADGDSQLDVIAPTTDKFLKPHINVISYSKESKKFELKENAELPQFK